MEANVYSTTSPLRVGTIRKIHERLLSDGFHISQYSLRLWIKNGILPAVFSGNKAYISYEAVVEILTNCSATNIG